MWTKEAIGAIIKETRIAAGLTQSQVANALGRPQQTIANWEVGRSQPDADTLFELFKLLGADLNTAFGFPSAEKKNALQYSTEALKIAKRFDELDNYGQSAVSGLVNVEHTRCTAQKARAARQGTEESSEMGAESVFYYFPMYESPMSAGTGQIAGQEYPENVRLVKEPPQGASYIAPVRGDSMEPTFKDGDLLFIRATPEIERGQIGVFLMDGQQWVKELGDDELISHNPRYVPVPMTEDIQCQGLVLGVCDESYFE